MHHRWTSLCNVPWRHRSGGEEVQLHSVLTSTLGGVGDEHHVLAALQPAKALVQHVQNVMAHPQKPDLVFQQNGLVHLNLSGGQFSRLLAVEECGSADKPWTDHVPTYSARLLATHSICIFPLNFPSRASPCAIRFRTANTRTALGGISSLGEWSARRRDLYIFKTQQSQDTDIQTPRRDSKPQSQQTSGRRSTS